MHLSQFRQLLGKGYYNFYWDKRDDRGRHVPEGPYSYRLEDCSRDSSWPLTVVYKEGEKDCLFFRPIDRATPQFGYEIIGDSVVATLEILRNNRKPYKTIFADSLMAIGQYRYEWAPDSTDLEGWYIIRMTAGSLEYSSKFKVDR